MKTIRETGGSVLVHTCEHCGADAPFGYGVHLRLALQRKAAGDLVAAKRHLGQWYCGEHRPQTDGATA